MQEKLINDDDNEINERIIIEANGKFIPNKCPLQLEGQGQEILIKRRRKQKSKNNYYDIKGMEIDKTDFHKAFIFKLEKFPLIIIIISMLFCITFYILIYSIIIFQDKILIVYICIIYIIGTLIQNLIIPKPFLYEGKNVLINEMKKIINSDVKIFIGFKTKNNKKIKKFKFPSQYVVDITGVINIPQKYNFIKLGDIQYFFDSDYLDFKRKYSFKNKLYYYKKYFYNGKLVSIKGKIFMVNQQKNNTSKNITTFCISILLLHWIKSLYYKYSSFYECIKIYPHKLISKKHHLDSPTKINIQGNIIEAINHLKEPIDIKEDNISNEIKIENMEKDNKKEEEEIEEENVEEEEEDDDDEEEEEESQEKNDKEEKKDDEKEEEEKEI